ncbi:unnamed protein product (macronuclear) [Paramecium tetraurelia]|uniref:Uncharacterized protein n=1 Tax=Paramecium tetraurelia TaxID=5888 RepID=A0CHC0_PARTE|nr:uncharacterized protein GSPATT00038289001 [Paramecium tetraurelia]CAK70187.1 unnamed protein product [Paramecium tetraurelia]|eukprot:XP_001437584.1 hypothetical protein (macronuclear) [Paramecium tetraurelia strain d4-2]
MSGVQIKGPQNILRKHKTEPDKLSRFHSSDMRGPFKYEPLQNISHPIQPDDDVSVRDPTLRTVDKSKLSQSQYQINSIRSKTPISEPDESPFMLTFPQRQLETTRKRSKSKLIMYFIERIRKRFKIDSKAKQFQYLFDQETNSKDYNCTLYEFKQRDFVTFVMDLTSLELDILFNFEFDDCPCSSVNNFDRKGFELRFLGIQMSGRWSSIVQFFHREWTIHYKLQIDLNPIQQIIVVA